MASFSAKSSSTAYGNATWAVHNPMVIGGSTDYKNRLTFASLSGGKTIDALSLVINKTSSDSGTKTWYFYGTTDAGIVGNNITAATYLCSGSMTGTGTGSFTFPFDANARNIISGYTGTWYLLIDATSPYQTTYTGGSGTTGPTLNGSYIDYTACTAPTSASVSPAVSEGDATLTFSGAAGGTANAITGYEIQYAESTDNATWGAWVALKVQASTATSGTIAVAPSGTRGTYRKYQMRTQGAAGSSWYSGWKAVSGSVRRNSTPSAPTLNAPVASTTIYNSRPRILATVGADANSHAQTISISGYAASSTGNQAVGKQIVFMASAAVAAGSQSVSATSTDALGVTSGATTRAFTYAVPSWTDGTLTAGTTPIKAVHINEIRTLVNNVRAYYGMAAYSWAEAVTAGSTSLAGWTGHVTEIRTAIDQIVTRVNGWDSSVTTNNISLPAWTTITENKPTAAIINQLRAAIPLL